jgi:outer membrane immunogenic protein
MKTAICAAAAAIALMGTPVLAADVAVRAAPPAPAPVPYPANNWTGFYVGGEIGGGWGSSTATVVTNFGSSFPPGTLETPVDYHGFLGGFYGGYNYQINQFVIGVDADGTWADLNGSATQVSAITGDISNRNSTVNWIATATGRLGWAWANWLFFAKGGWAWAGVEGNSTTTTPGGVVASTFTTQDTRQGWTVGGGIEWGVSEHVSFKLEYDYVKFDTANFDATGDFFTLHPPLSGVSVARSATSNLNMVKGGIAYRF